MTYRLHFRTVSLALGCLVFTACTTLEHAVQPQVDKHSIPEAEATVHAGAPEVSLRAMTLNIAHARGTGFNQMFQSTRTARANLNNIAQLLKEQAPDIVSLQEADRQSFWNGNFNHVEFLAESAGYQRSFSGTHVDGLGLDYGTAVVAKLDLERPQSTTFDSSDAAGKKGFVVTSIRWPGKECVEVDVVSVHLDFASEVARLQQADEMIASLKQRDRPMIVMGDFNTGWHRENSAVRKLAEALELHSFEPDDRSLITIPKFKRRLDWILVSPEIRFDSYRVVETQVSDHLGVVSDLDIDRGCG